MIRRLIKTGLIVGLEPEEEGFWPEIPWETVTFLHSPTVPS